MYSRWGGIRTLRFGRGRVGAGAGLDLPVVARAVRLAPRDCAFICALASLFEGMGVSAVAGESGRPNDGANLTLFLGPPAVTTCKRRVRFREE